MLDTVDGALAKVEREREDRLELPANGTSLTFLQMVYRNANLPLGMRMRAASQAIQFEHPKLAVQASVSEWDGWVRKLDQAIEQSQRVLQTRKLEDGSFVPADAQNGDG